MKKALVAAAASLMLSSAAPAMASLVNVNTQNTFHPNNNLRCSGQSACSVVDSTIEDVVDVALP